MVEPIRTGLREYATFVVEDEWPRMARGELDPMGGVRLDELRSRIIELTSDDDDEREARTTTLGHLSAIGAARAQRAADAAATPPAGPPVPHGPDRAGGDLLPVPRGGPGRAGSRCCRWRRWPPSWASAPT
ncbi:hypothetical protein ACFSTC_30720 [Nonomuraea ferruginea]